jgi:hypothetical protein
VAQVIEGLPITCKLEALSSKTCKKRKKERKNTVPFLFFFVSLFVKILSSVKKLSNTAL